MKNIEMIILNALLDKYENSKSFLGRNKVQQKFSLTVSTLFPKYGDHSEYDTFRNVNEVIDILVRKKLIVATINKANVCSKVTLNTNVLDEVYNYIGRVQKKELNQIIIRTLNKYKDKNEILSNFCRNQLDRLQDNRSVQFFNGDLIEFDQILHVVDKLLRVESEIYVRDFSIQLFSDSKTFERISSKVVNLLFEYGNFPEKNQVLESLYLIKTPTYVNFKGAGSIVLSNQKIDLATLSGDIAISSILIDSIEKIIVTGSIVMTVENLTSFNKLNSPDVFFIYLGGFHNSVRRNFIKRLYNQNPNKTFYHFGDIDAGGFYILEHLRRLTGIDFKPYKMDISTLKEYSKYSKTLTDNDRGRLLALKQTEFCEVIGYMLENNCKLEQEAVDTSNKELF